MRISTLWWFGALGAAALLWALSRTKAGQAAAGAAAGGIGEDLSTVGSALGLISWKDAGAGPTWVPVLNDAERRHGLPQDLLARVAFQESSFRESVIRGETASAAGALGIMQLMPAYFASVRVPVPFTDAQVVAQINEAAAQLAALYGRFADWSLALAAYNAGAGNVDKYGGIPPFPETERYVAAITADLPALSEVNA